MTDRQHYSDEMKGRAIEYFFAHQEMSPMQVVAELGYPGVFDTLLGWVRDDPRYVPRGWSWAPFPGKAKLAAVERVLVGGERVAGVARDVGASEQTVYNWLRTYEKGGAAALMPKEPRNGPLPEVPDGTAELVRRNRELELENDILRQTIELLKKDPGLDASKLTNREKALVIEALRPKYRLKDLTASLRISKSSYEYQRKAVARGDKYGWLRPLVAEEFLAEDGARGYRVVTHRLRMREEPVVVSEKVVRAIMRQDGLTVRCKAKPKKYSSYAGETDERPENIPLNEDGSHDFRADAPNEKWVSDITEFKLPDAPKVYLSPVVDLFDGKPVGWAISGSPDAELANSSLLMACSQLAPGEHPFCHTDGGFHYRWPVWKSICETHGITRSMSRKGRSPDNAACLCAA